MVGSEDYKVNVRNTVSLLAVRNRKTLMLIGVIVVVIGVVSVTRKLLLHTTNNLIPAAITQQAAFTAFYPKPQVPGIVIRTSSVTYNTANFALSYTVRVHNKGVAVSEQATPDVFSQDGVYAYKLSQAHEYDEFQTNAGDVALTRPSELHGQTLAWVNARGTLTLAHAAQNLSGEEWKLLFNNMVVSSQ